MLLEAQKGNAEIIEKAVALLRGKVPEGKIALAETFTRQYYSRVEADDLAERNLSDLCGAALAHLDFVGKFKSGAPKLRVYNPQIQKDGWESSHTIIEVVNDDMPFLVDSVTMEINRQGLKAHLTIHPVIKTKREADGELNEILPPEVVQSGPSESVMHARNSGERLFGGCLGQTRSPAGPRARSNCLARSCNCRPAQRARLMPLA